MNPENIKKMTEFVISKEGSKQKAGNALGVSYQTITNWCNGAKPAKEKLQELIEYVEVAKFHGKTF